MARNYRTMQEQFSWYSKVETVISIWKSESHAKKISKLIFAEAAHFTLISVEHFQDIGRTPVLELNMRTSCPDVDEKDSFKSPGPTTMVSFRGMSAKETCALLLPEHLWQEYTNGIAGKFSTKNKCINDIDSLQDVAKKLSEMYLFGML